MAPNTRPRQDVIVVPPPAAEGLDDPTQLGDADVALLEEPTDPPAAAVAMPPPLPPRSGAAEVLALPGPDSEFERYAPALAEPEPAFEVAGSAWATALSGVGQAGAAAPELRPSAEPRPVPEVRQRNAPPRPAPPVIPPVAGHPGVPPALAPNPRGAAPMSAPPFGPAAADVPEELSFSAGPPSIADDLFGASAPSSTFVSGERQVVIHTREGQALRGSLRDVDLESAALPLETKGGTVRLPVDRLRAVFFMVPIGAPLPEPRGRKAKVVFEDGRPVSGLVADYRHDDPGFFLAPLETRGRTERIYVYRDAIRSISFA
jgi:hypothetical protein